MSGKTSKAPSVPKCDWPFTEVLPDEHSRELETIKVHVARVEPSRTSTVLDFVRAFLPPMVSMEHCKRIRRMDLTDTNQARDQIHLELILCQHDALTTDALKAKLIEHKLDMLALEVREVPRHAPVNKAQFETWRSLWPLNYREDTRLDPKFTMDDIDHAIQHMRSILSPSTVLARIVDPKTNTILAEKEDTRQDGHPLHHAIMNCIDAVAYAERERYSDGGRAKRKLHANAGYLCTGYDLYCSHEPCAMCAMALVHSRIGRVFYSLPTKTGCLGSVHKIHSHPSLNHHFRVFQGLLKEENQSLWDSDEPHDA